MGIVEEVIENVRIFTEGRSSNHSLNNHKEDLMLRKEFDGFIQSRHHHFHLWKNIGSYQVTLSLGCKGIEVEGFDLASKRVKRRKYLAYKD